MIYINSLAISPFEEPVPQLLREGQGDDLPLVRQNERKRRGFGG